MYWIYLILFILMIVTPELTQRGVLFFSEDDLESVLIFSFGMVGLLLYLGRESAFLKAVREKLSLQQETNQIKKDLSQSYSYIGEMNRRIDIVKNMVAATPSTLVAAPSNKTTIYEPIFDATMLLAHSDCVALYIVDVQDGVILERYQEGRHMPALEHVDGVRLTGSKKFLWEEGGLTFVRSAEDAQLVGAFLVFHTMKNRLEEMGIFQILASQALSVYWMNRQANERTASTQ